MSASDELSKLYAADPMLAYDAQRISRTASIARRRVIEYRNQRLQRRSDEVVGEEPLEIRVVTWEKGIQLRHRLAVTMRTPGADFELAAGFLFSEGVIGDRTAIERIAYCTDAGEVQQYNVVNVFLKPRVQLDLKRLSRNVYTTSSCGVCSKAALEFVENICPQPPLGPSPLTPAYLFRLQRAMCASQPIFSRTGGSHASALFDPQGESMLRREDVGRHNATDKLIGGLLLQGRLPASDTTIVFSGRAAFELVQKALLAGIPKLVSIGAPTSLAVDLARRYGATLVSFLRKDRFNVYTGEERIDRGADGNG